VQLDALLPEHSAQVESQAVQTLLEAKVAVGQAARQPPLELNGAKEGQLVHSVDEAPEHVAQLLWQSWQTPLSSANMPSGQAATQEVPCLYGVATAHVVQSLAAPATQVAHVEWQAAQAATEFS